MCPTDHRILSHLIFIQPLRGYLHLHRSFGRLCVVDSNARFGVDNNNHFYHCIYIMVAQSQFPKTDWPIWMFLFICEFWCAKKWAQMREWTVIYCRKLEGIRTNINGLADASGQFRCRQFKFERFLTSIACTQSYFHHYISRVCCSWHHSNQSNENQQAECVYSEPLSLLVFLVQIFYEPNFINIMLTNLIPKHYVGTFIKTV